jgi:hypothetical protein
MLPTAESACMEPSAAVRKCAGTLSATRVVAAPNIPPTPNPNRKRYIMNSRAACQAGQGGKDGEAQQRDNHGSDPAIAIANDSKYDPAGCPADHKGEGGDAAPVTHVRVAGSTSEQFAKGRFPPQHEDSLVHAIEEPAARSQDDDKPMVTGDLFLGSCASSRLGRTGGRGFWFRWAWHAVMFEDGRRASQGWAARVNFTRVSARIAAV